MSANNGNKDVGYGRPPKHSQWQKNQSGNRKGRPRINFKKVSQIVEEQFAREIDVIVNDVKYRVTIFEAITTQLLKKASGGDQRALNVLYKYEAYAKQSQPNGGIEIYIVKDEDCNEAHARLFQSRKKRI